MNRSVSNMLLGKQEQNLSYEGVFDLWFEGISSEQYCTKDTELDARIRPNLGDSMKPHVILWLQHNKTNNWRSTACAEILKFWFEDITPHQEYASDREFDALTKTKFGDLYDSVISGELVSWRNHPQGCLAEIIILNYFCRDMFCHTDQDFDMFDILMLKLVQDAIDKGFDRRMKTEHRDFLHKLLSQAQGSC